MILWKSCRELRLKGGWLWLGIARLLYYSHLAAISSAWANHDEDDDHEDDNDHANDDNDDDDNDDDGDGDGDGGDDDEDRAEDVGDWAVASEEYYF